MLCRGVVAHLSKAVLSSPRICFRFSSSLTLNSLPNSFNEGVQDGSAVYRHALKFQRPGIIKWCHQLDNTASFIGSVTRDPQVVNIGPDIFGVHTSLNVRSSKCSSFRLLLKMWYSMAEFAYKHLKRGDFIFVSGALESYTKDDGSGIPRLWHEVFVRELHFVAQRPCYRGHKVLESTQEVGTDIQNDVNRLHLWQVFFASPHEWWDNRKCKVNPKQPDFRHKDTGEALWLNEYDPPWVKRQLQKLDSEISEELLGPRSRLTTWVFHD